MGYHLSGKQESMVYSLTNECSNQHLDVNSTSDNAETISESELWAQALEQAASIVERYVCNYSNMHYIIFNIAEDLRDKAAIERSTDYKSLVQKKEIMVKK